MKLTLLLTTILISSGIATTAQTNTFPANGNVGIGTTAATAKITFNNVNDGSNLPDGITWYGPLPLHYGIYRTAGPWQAPYQQLKLAWETGIILYPGMDYEKSYVDISGGGLRVSSGNVGIGTLTPKEKLSVNGKIRAHEIKVETTNWPDYVFDQDYKILGLQELERYIKVNKHLPEMPSAKEIAKDGIAVGDMLKVQQKKIEELTLILIQKDKELSREKSMNKKQEERLGRIEKLLLKK